MNTPMFTPAILPQANSSNNISNNENSTYQAIKPRVRSNPFIRSGNVTGIALEFFVRQMASRLIPRSAADFLSKICNVAAASEAYQIYYSKTTMAEKAGVCPKSVQRYMRVIEASGIMTRTIVTDSIKGHQPNVYTFAPEFISAVRAFFEKQLSPSKLKMLRTIAQAEVSKLVDKALAPFISGMRKVLNFKAAQAFFNSLPIGQADPSPPGQIDPQEVVKTTEEESKNLTHPDAKGLIASKIKIITGQQRRAMTSEALTKTRKHRQVEIGKELRAAYARKAQSTFLTKRDARSAASAAQDKQTSYNHARIVAEGKRHDEALKHSIANAQKDPETIKNHIANMRAMFSKKR